MEVIGRLLKDSEGTESSALQVLAEEEGLTKGEVDSAVHTLKENGRIDVESGPDGSKLLRWVEQPSTPSSPGREP